MSVSRSLSTSLLLLLMTSSSWAAAIGGVEAQSGEGKIEREGTELASQVKSEIFMDDLVHATTGDIGITFVDETTVAISPGSELLIDDFVYDPNNDSSNKLGVNVVSGTVRYASGAIAHTNPQNVNVETPTATIAVRGTNFTATVDELGRSQIILLPNIDGTVGKILVSNLGGTVTLDMAFQAVVVNTREQKPSEPKVIRIDPRDINNLMIIKPPRELVEQYTDTVANALDYDALEYNELKQDLLEVAKFESELDINQLDVDLLQNQLDAEAAAFAAEMRGDGAGRDGNVPGQNPATQVTTLIDFEGGRTVVRQVDHTAQIRVGSDANYKIDLKQNGLNIPMQIGDDSGGKITINQSN